MAIELFNNGTHLVIGFYDLGSDEGIQSNQFLVVDGNHSAIIDPGGNLTHNDLVMCSRKYWLNTKLDYVIGSHQDPDVLSSLNKWLVETDCQVIVPAIWGRFIAHYAAPNQFKKRLIGIPDFGMNIQLGNAIVKAVPAHFLHSEGNFQFYDSVSKILFSGDMGASPFLRYFEKVEQPIEDFDAHIPNIEGYHRRFMANNKVCRYWANMVRGLDIEWLVPQHGRSFKGKEMIERFLKWIEELQCGTDLVTQETYKIP
ncbi:MAG: MBL fold metallo-hydrolase [Candidatus Parabeggiatoa sp. nov. 1]|nr:MAG: MBL fold metallo-hydrolase [Gammaproteobacteria bacterium]